MDGTLYDAFKNRRSQYQLTNTSPVSDDEICEIVRFCTQHTPTAYNSQNTRVCVLLGDNHARLWDIVLEALKKEVPPEAFGRTQKKIDGFKAAYGSLLFFEDMAVVEALQEKFPLYRDSFPTWSTQGCGMLQYALWVALEAEGLGASLQHYNPLIDDAVLAEWQLSKDWKLVAQMPFGMPAAAPGEKTFMDIDQRVKVFHI